MGSRRRLRTKTNALIVSPALADFCVGSFAVPSLFFCHINGWLQLASTLCALGGIYKVALCVRLSIMNLCSLVFDRYMAVVKTLKYVNFMTARRIIFNNNNIY